MSAICFTCLRTDNSLRYMMQNDALILQLLLSPDVNVAHRCFARTRLHLCDKCMRMLDCVCVFRNVAAKSVRTQIHYWNENNKKENNKDVDKQPEIQNNDQLRVEDIKQETITVDDEIEKPDEVITSDIKTENDILPNNTNIEDEHLLDEQLLRIKTEIAEKKFDIEAGNYSGQCTDRNENEDFSETGPEVQDATSNIEVDNSQAPPMSLIDTEMILNEENIPPKKRKTQFYLEEHDQISWEPKMCNMGVEMDKPQNPNGSLVGRLLGRMLEISPYFNGGIPTSSEPGCEDTGNVSPEPEIQPEDTLEITKKIPRKVKEVKKSYRRIKLSERELKIFQKRQKFRDPFRSALYKCVPCIMVFENARFLEKHLVDCHSQREGYAACPMCSRTMRPDVVKRHKRKHYRVVTCAFCDYMAKDVCSLKRHPCP